MQRFELSTGRKMFAVVNCIGLLLLTALSILPFLHLFAVSLSSPAMANSGAVGLIPKEPTLKAYEYVLSQSGFVRAFIVSLIRVALGTAISLTVTILVAYPLSKSEEEFRGRKYFVAFFYFTAFFSGGLIPAFMIMNSYGMIDKMTSLIIPNACIFFNIILMANFFRSIPKAVEEAAIVDGASQFAILRKIILPVSKPGIATLTLFIVVFHWNSWFDGLIYMNSAANYPLQSYLSTLIMPVSSNILQNENAVEILKVLSEKAIKAANVFLGALPIMIVFPFLQKYFIKGIMLGSVKE